MEIIKLYILDGKNPILCDDIDAYGDWMWNNNTRISRETVGESEISTIFLGLDHSFNGKIPILFETMVFDGPLDGEMIRYATWDEAMIGHKVMIKKVKNSFK